MRSSSPVTMARKRVVKSGSSCRSGRSWRKVFTDTSGFRTSCAISCVRRPSAASRSSCLHVGVDSGEAPLGLRRGERQREPPRRRREHGQRTGTCPRGVRGAGEQHGEGAAFRALHGRCCGEAMARREPAQHRARFGREQRARRRAGGSPPRTLPPWAPAEIQRRWTPRRPRACRPRAAPRPRRSRSASAPAAARPRR